MGTRRDYKITLKNDVKILPHFPIPEDLKHVLRGELKATPNAIRYSDLLDKIQLTNKYPLTIDNYVEFLDTALYAEEYHQRIDLNDYDMKNQKLKRHDHLGYEIEIEGLEEDRPSIRIKDKVKIIDPRGKNYILMVEKIFKKYIIVDEKDSNFLCVYNRNDLYDIEFIFNNYTYRCCHHALQLMRQNALISYVFPEKLKNDEKINTLKWFNKLIANNPEQRRAVISILNMKQGPPYILYGPPGTGKTVTLIEAICQAYKKIKESSKNNRIVVCTPSNTSADFMAKKLIKHKPIKTDLIRLYCVGIKADAVDKDLVEYSNCIIDTENGEKRVKLIMPLVKELPTIIVLTLITCTRLLLERLRVGYVFFDEAGQATESESTIPLCLIRSDRPGRLQGKIVVAGDHNQLGPVIMSNKAKPLLEKSMFERLMRLNPYQKDPETGYNQRYITKLVRNYRSHPAIIHVPNELFYEGELIPCNEANVRWCENWEKLPNPNFPVIFEGVRGVEIPQVFTQKEKYKSYYNNHEMDAVYSYLKHLVGLKINNRVIRGKDIGVVTPFTSQKVKIKNMIESSLKVPNTKSEYDDIEVGSVQLYQGREKEIIIFSAVRSRVCFPDSKTPLGFLSSSKRFNVALTRAKALLIIIGHPEILAEDRKNWKKMIDFCRENNAVRDFDSSVLRTE